MMPSPTGQVSVSQANLAATSMASSMSFPSLGNLNNSLLSGLSLGNFDPKNNPLLMPFGGIPNLGGLGGLGNLGNLGNMSLTNSLFANLAGLGLPSLAGMEAALGATATSSADTNATTSSGKNSSSNNTGSGKSRNKMDVPTSKSSAPSTSTSSSMPTTTPFPFFFPNPSLLYSPLGLGGLNPFSMQPGVSSAYESLAQCGLLTPPTSTASSRKTTSTSNSSRQRDTTIADTIKRKENEKKSRYATDAGISLQQYADMALHSDDRKRQSENEKKEIIELSQIADLSARLERKSKEQEMKEALEQLSRTSAELLTRNLEDPQRPSKRGRSADQSYDQPPSLEVTLEPVVKKVRVTEPEATKTSEPTESTEEETAPPAATSVSSTNETEETPQVDATASSSSSKTDNNKPNSSDGDDDVKSKVKKARSVKRLSNDPPPERKNLRSSAGRQARAAAERQARMEGEQQLAEQRGDGHAAD